jgi:hypothetical protein
MQEAKALRYNSGKLKWHNFPMFLFRPVAKVGHFGADKYETYNFLKGAPITQYLDCMKRHLDAFEDTEQSDIDESGENHLAHVAWNAMVAIWVLNHMPELDDRFRSPDKKTEELT